ncbi:hypothetical protein WJX72_001355 [[Myrmecia] bisecta]|uniref:GDT1 family protein n=1 Tax=[Myrmecia] bisecta TaxID=41462 RepID=A0AAW1R4H7_9CHLO
MQAPTRQSYEAQPIGERQREQSGLASGSQAAVVGAIFLASLAAAGPALALPGVDIDHLKQAADVPGLLGDSPLREGFVSGFLLILFSELGDKTFFIAVLLALKQNKALVFAGTFSALAVMTVISVGLGEVFHQLDELLPANSLPVDDLLAVVLLVFFGVQTLQAAATAEESADDEQKEAEEEVSRLGGGTTLGLFLSTFALVFAAEWGDKSFLATIALAASSSPAGVVTGAVAGHGVATGIAVLGGSFLGKYVSERVVQYVGGSLFLVFAAATVIDIIRGV